MTELERKLASAKGEVADAIEHGDRKGRWYAEGKRDALQAMTELPAITTRIIPEHGFVILSRFTGPHLSGPVIEAVNFWHKGNHPDPSHASRVNLNQLRKLNSTPNRQYAVAVVAMPPEEAWED